MKKRYLILLLKRLLRRAPAAAAVGIAVALALSLAASAALDSYEESGLLKVRVGLCGDLDDPYVKLVEFTLQNVDEFREYVILEQVDPDKAYSLLDSGYLDGLIVVPEGFVESIIARDPLEVRFVMPSRPANLQSAFTYELVRTVEGLVRQTQDGIYGIQDLARSLGKGEDVPHITDKIMDAYSALILSRDLIFDARQIPVEGVGLTGYYFCAVFTFFALLWGVACYGFLGGDREELKRLIAARGAGPLPQLLCEGAVYTGFSVLFFVLCAAVSSALLPESVSPGAGFYPALIFVCLCLCPIQIFLYEIFDSPLGSALSQLLFALFGGFVSWLFYPSWFFDPGVAVFFSRLPVGAAFGALREAYCGSTPGIPALLCAVWGAAFFLLAVAARRLKAGGDGA